MSRRPLNPTPPNALSDAGRNYYRGAWGRYESVRSRLNELLSAEVTHSAEISASQAAQQEARSAIGTALDADTAYDLEQDLRRAKESERTARSALGSVRAELPGVRERFAELRVELDRLVGNA